MNESLARLGLAPYFMRQLSPEEFESGLIARVVAVQRSGITLSDGQEELTVALGGRWTSLPPGQRPTVGDWVVLDERREQVLRLLERKSVFRRVAAGTKLETQLIAANVDTLFIVTSCNEEFSESRLERYLALAYEAGVDPVVVLTKADLVDDAGPWRDRVANLSPGLPVEAVNALDPVSLEPLLDWVGAGSTVSLVGSSGVGKSTLLNSLSGSTVAATRAVREDDARGRHTTTSRSLHLLPNGGILLDVPGMRELKIADAANALGEVFADIESLAEDCRFRDCRHEREPGCRVLEAVEAGALDRRRLDNYRKLLHEEAHYLTGLAEQRRQDRRFGKVIRQHLDLKRQVGRKHASDG